MQIQESLDAWATARERIDWLVALRPVDGDQKALDSGDEAQFRIRSCGQTGRNNRNVKAFEVERAREKAQVSLGSEGRPGLVARARP